MRSLVLSHLFVSYAPTEQLVQVVQIRLLVALQGETWYAFDEQSAQGMQVQDEFKRYDVVGHAAHVPQVQIGIGTEHWLKYFPRTHKAPVVDA